MTSPEPPTAAGPAYGATPELPRGPVRIWDVFLTGIILVADAGLTLIVAVFGLYLAETVSVCGVRDCDTTLVFMGMAIATVLPWIILVTAVVSSIVLLIVRRFAFWVPIVGGVLIVIAFFIGGGLATAGVPPA